MGGKFEREKDGERVETARTFDINVEWGRAGDSGSGLLLRQQMFFKTNWKIWSSHQQKKLTVLVGEFTLALATLSSVKKDLKHPHNYKRKQIDREQDEENQAHAKRKLIELGLK